MDPAVEPDGQGLFRRHRGEGHSRTGRLDEPLYDMLGGDSAADAATSDHTNRSQANPWLLPTAVRRRHVLGVRRRIRHRSFGRARSGGLEGESQDMLRTGILNPAINSLVSRIRHTNTLVIADRGFPFWPQVETIDISLVDDIPKVLDVLRAIRLNFAAGRAFMAEEFRGANVEGTCLEFERALAGIPLVFEPHVEVKKRVPQAIGFVSSGGPAN